MQICKERFQRMFFLFLAMMVTIGYGHAWADTEHDPSGIIGWGERVSISGTVESDYYQTERSDIADKDSDGASDLFVSTVELGIGVSFTDVVTGNILFLGEDLGTEDETDVTIDEAFVTVKGESPLYLVAGKRVLPFGVYENHLLNDPITQDAYETSRAGATLGLEGPLGLDLSFTVYKGEEMMDHLFDSRLFETDDTASVFVTRQAGETNDVDSYVYAASIAPIEDVLTVFGSYLTEPGRGKRNRTMSAGASLRVGNIILDGEYMEAVSREKYLISGTVADDEYKEKVYAVGAAYQFVLREREVVGGALFAERKAHTVSEPLEVAVRYEKFDDDKLYKDSLTWSVDTRWSAGARYAFYEDAQSGLVSYIAAEYRHTDFNVHDSQVDRAEDNNEYLVRLGVSF